MVLIHYLVDCIYVHKATNKCNFYDTLIYQVA